MKEPDQQAKTFSKRKKIIVVIFDILIFVATLITILMDLYVIAFIFIVSLLICVFISLRMFPLDVS